MQSTAKLLMFAVDGIGAIGKLYYKMLCAGYFLSSIFQSTSRTSSSIDSEIFQCLRCRRHLRYLHVCKSGEGDPVPGHGHFAVCKLCKSGCDHEEGASWTSTSWC